VDGLVFTLFAVAAFAGGFVSGFSGFAMGLVVSGVWLHIITPMQTAALIAGLRAAHAGLRHIQAAPYPRLPEGVAARGWDHYQHPDRRRCSRLPQSGVPAVRGRCAAGALHGLRPDAACVRGEYRNRSGHRDWRLERLAWRPDGTGWRDLDDLVPVARLAKGRAARGVSAGAVRGIRSDLRISSRCLHYYQRYVGALRLGRPIHGRGSFGPALNVSAKSTTRCSAKLC
jgi:hypothetical protein